MKKVYIISAVIAFLFASCDLDKQPETDFQDKTFWKSESDLRAACNQLYSQLSGFLHDTRSDELVKKTADAVSSGNRTVPHESDNWEKPYERIYAANKILDFAPNANISESKLNRWLAEAYFFRAYHYFGLVQNYGDVPLILKSFDSPKDPVIYSGRTSREEVIQQCYKDLEFAVEWLPSRKEIANDWGRAMRSSALGLIVRIGLYEGTYGKYHGLNSDYNAHLSKSIEAAEALMKEGHDLYPDFEKLFTFDGEGSANLENVFVKVYGPNGAGTIIHSNCRQMESTVSLTRQMVDMFLYEDGLPREKSKDAIIKEKSFNDIFVKRDPRLAMTIFKVGEIGYKSDYQPLNQSHGFGYSLRKGFTYEEWNTSQKETVDKMLIRYAEVLLSYAEAVYEKNGSISDEILDNTVNKVRQRAGFDVKLTNEFVNTNGLNMLDEIRRERTVELLDEGFRYDDIIRWKIAEYVLPKAIIGAKFVDSETSKKRDDIKKLLTDADGKLNGVQVYDDVDMYVIERASTRQFDPERDYLYPVPMKEIIRTNNAITQNPNWDK